MKSALTFLVFLIVILSVSVQMAHASSNEEIQVESSESSGADDLLDDNDEDSDKNLSDNEDEGCEDDECEKSE